MKPIISWLSENDILTIYTSKYWNNIEEEKLKDWWIIDDNINQTLNYLECSGLMDEYHAAEKMISNFPETQLEIADLGAGTGWASALLSKLPNVAKIHAVDISRHRLDFLFEKSFLLMGGDEKKLNRYLGNFSDLKFEDSSIDIIFCCQAFHHTDKPLKFLSECDRILKSGGKMIMIGEPYIGFKQIIRKFLIKLIIERKLVTTFCALFPTEDIKGDHNYRVSDYTFIFRTIMGYMLKIHTLRNGKVIYFAVK